MSFRTGTRVGLHGGNSIWELGSQRDMLVFFGCLDCLAQSNLSEMGRFVLFDRLFKRYLRPEDLDEAVSAFMIAREQFRLANMKDVQLERLGFDRDETALQIDQANPGMIFERYFEALFDCIESYRLGKQNFGFYYNPVKISRTDLPGFVEDKARDKKLYDELTGPPYWFPVTGH